MSFESLTGVLAGAMGVTMSVAPLLQARRVRQMGDSSEVSVSLFVIFAVGCAVWVMRGVATADAVVIVPNALGFVVQTVTLAVVLHYRPPRVRR